MNRSRKIIEIIAVFFALIAINVAVSYAAAISGSIALALVLPELCMAGVVVAASVLFKSRPVPETLNVYPASPRGIFPSAVFAVGGYFVMLASSLIMSAIFPALTNTTDENLYQYYLKDSGIFFIIITIVVIPAICEEIIFRGYFLNRLTEVMPPLPAILLSGLLFGIAHLDLYKLVPVTVMGIALSYIAYKTRSIFITALLHMINNALSVAALFRLDGGTSDAGSMSIVTETKMIPWLALGYLAIGGLFVYIGLKLFKQIRLRGWKSVLIIVGCIVLYFVSAFCAVMSVVNFRVHDVETVRFPEQTEYSTTFTLDKPRLSLVSVVVTGRTPIHAEITITDEDGNTVYSVSGDDPAAQDIITLGAGVHTIRYTLSAPDGKDPVETDCSISGMVVSLYAVDTGEQTADSTG